MRNLWEVFAENLSFRLGEANAEDIRDLGEGLVLEWWSKVSFPLRGSR
jgi:hypothetical protein